MTRACCRGHASKNAGITSQLNVGPRRTCTRILVNAANFAESDQTFCSWPCRSTTTSVPPSASHNFLHKNVSKTIGSASLCKSQIAPYPSSSKTSCQSWPTSRHRISIVSSCTTRTGRASPAHVPRLTRPSCGKTPSSVLGQAKFTGAAFTGNPAI